MKIYIGCNVDGFPTNDIVEVEKHAAKLFENCTCYLTIGHWQGRQEETLVIEVYGMDEQKAEELALQLGKKFKQESVMVVHTRVDECKLLVVPKHGR